MVRGRRRCWVGLAMAAVLLGCGTKQPPIAAPPEARPKLEPAAEPVRAELTFERIEIPRLEVPPLELEPRNQSYELPVTQEALINLERDVVEHGLLRKSAPELRRLLERGMVIVPSSGARRFDQAYADLRDKNIPILVSADAVLHQQHILFNEILKAVEVRTLAPMLAALLAGLHDELASELGRLPRRSRNAEPALNELAVISVARKTLDPEFVPLSAVRARVERDVARMEQHRGVELSAAQSSARCLQTRGGAGRCYREDFSQYVPRGHYTVSESLRRYFKAMMWLGRMGRRLKYDDELLQQVILIRAAKRATCRFLDRDVPATVLLGRMDQILSFFVGASDDLTLPEVDGVVRQQLGTRSDLELSSAVLDALRRELRRLRAPRILSGGVEAYGDDADDTTQEETQGLRLLGQRFAPDSEMLGQLVFAHVGPDPEHARFAEVAQDAATTNRDDICDDLALEPRQELPQLSREESSPEQGRCICERSVTLTRERGFSHDEERDNRSLTQVCRLMPSGLDVAAAMGSELAERYLEPSRRYAGYTARFAELRQSYQKGEANGETAVRTESLYQNWLDALSPLLQPVSDGYPTWMTGHDYRKKSLRTFLASWAELRHDTILYVKQSYTTTRIELSSLEIEVRPPEAYGRVEPRPELYLRLKLMIGQLRLVLAALSNLPEEVDDALASAESLLERLTRISIKQLEGQDLDETDEQFIKRIGGALLGVAKQVVAALPSAPSSEPKPRGSNVVEIGLIENLADALTVPLVADVHTDLHTGRVLEVGTGPLERMLVVSRMPDGQLSVAVGYVFSYREFVHPLDDRLTNEKWRGSLKAGAKLAAPRWWSEDRPLSNGFELPRFDQSRGD